MAAKRGLNKGRGLSSLIPNKLDQAQKSADATEQTSIGTESVSEESENKAGSETENKTTQKTGNSGKRTQTTVKKTGTASAKNAKKETSRTNSESGKTEESGTKMLKITQIVPNQDQPRKEFGEEAIEELAASIKSYGVIQPLLVQKKGRYYEIIAGERRWRAAKAAGIKEVPVIIGDYSDQEVKELSLIENIQREDLNAMEEAEAYRNLMEEFNLTQEEVAAKVGKKRSTVTNSLRLLKLAGPVRHLLVKGDISMGHARALLSLEDQEMQVTAAHQIIQKKLSVRETEKLVKTLLNPRKPREKAPVDEQIALAYKNLEEQMQKKFGSKVAIKANGDKGKIEIEYYSQDDLERIIDLLS